MIVVDTNIIAYLYLPTESSELADRLLTTHPDWTAPVLWRSELRNVLAHYLRKAVVDFENAFSIQSEAEALMAENEYEVDSYDVLRLVERSGCSAYDCEFVALAQKLGTQLITVDKKILKAFPDVAVSLSAATH